LLVISGYRPIQHRTPPCRLHAPLPVALDEVPSLQIAPTLVVPVLFGHHGAPVGGFGGCGFAVGRTVGAGAVVGTSVGTGAAVGAGAVAAAGFCTIGKYDTGTTPSALAGRIATATKHTHAMMSAMTLRCFMI
jgi:hypothetical protein